MAIKIIQDTVIPRLEPSAGVAATSVPIALKSGYLRITIGSTTGSAGGYIAIGTNPSVTTNSYHIPSYSESVIKETLKKQRIVGIITGPTTIVSFGENNGNYFNITDYVTIENAITSGINTTHNKILSLGPSSLEIEFDSSSITNLQVGNAQLCRSVKVAVLTEEPDTFFNISEVVTLVSE